MKADQIVRHYQRQMAPRFEAAARHLRDQLRGASPQDTGEYADRWDSTTAAISRDSVVASAFNDTPADGAELPLGLLLEFGTEDTPPQPHIRAAVRRSMAGVRKILRGNR